MEENLSRYFLLGCALSPVARQRPADLSLDRTEDWVKDIVLVNVSILYFELTYGNACYGELFKAGVHLNLIEILESLKRD